MSCRPLSRSPLSSLSSSTGSIFPTIVNTNDTSSNNKRITQHRKKRRIMILVRNSMTIKRKDTINEKSFLVRSFITKTRCLSNTHSYHEGACHFNYLRSHNCAWPSSNSFTNQQVVTNRYMEVKEESNTKAKQITHVDSNKINNNRNKYKGNNGNNRNNKMYFTVQEERSTPWKYYLDFALSSSIPALRLSLLVQRREQQPQQYSMRHFSSNRYENPYQVLGIPKKSSYKEVKDKFVQLALQYHPDQEQNNNHQHDSSSRTDQFVRIRHAFEQLRTKMKEKNKENKIKFDDEYDEFNTSWTDNELREWLKEQNQTTYFGMDRKTQKEVIATLDILSPAGLDHGGIWYMARMLKAREQKFGAYLCGDDEDNNDDDNGNKKNKRNIRLLSSGVNDNFKSSNSTSHDTGSVNDSSSRSKNVVRRRRLR